MSDKGGIQPTIPTYYVGLQYVLCHGPIDEITEIYVSEKLAWSGTGEDQDRIFINKPELFGGTSREGGIKGKVDLFFGRVTQPINDYIQNKLRGGAPIPKFLGVVMLVARRIYVGTNYYLKPWWVLATRVHVRKHGLAQWQDALAEVPVSASFTKTLFKTLTHDGTTAVVTTYSLVDLKKGMTFTISGADYAPYNGTFTVASVNKTKNNFTYVMGSTPAGNSSITNLTLSYSIPGLMNGVHIIRDCLTDTSWGLGHPEYLINDTVFLEAAQTCYDEGLGFGFIWDGNKPVSDFIADVLSHIQASLYVNRTTGKFELKLIRKILDVESLITLDDSNVGEVSGLKRVSLTELTNQVTIKFLNNSTLKEDSYNIADSSLIQRQGAIVDKTTTYDGVTNVYLAQQFAIRDLHQLSIPTYSCTIKCKRIAENLNPGDAFILNRPDLVNAKLVFRVDTINLGLIDKGEITIEAVQDIFHAPTVIYGSPIGSWWADPIDEAELVQLKLLNELPYYLLATRRGDAFAQALDSTTCYLNVAAVSPVGSAYSAGLWTGPTTTLADLTRHGTVDFCFTGLLAANINKTDTLITLTSIEDIELLTVGHFIQFGAELCEVTAIDEDNEQLTIVRGVLDTVPVSHVIGERVWGWHNFSASDQVGYLIGETTYVSLTTITPKGELELYTPDVSLTFTGRIHLPYPPANVKINGQYWPTTVSHLSLNFTWATRNRILQTAGLIDWYSGSISSEDLVTYSWELTRTDTGALLASATGVAGTSGSASTAYIGEVKFKIWSSRDGLDSFQYVEHIFTTT